MSVFVLVAVLVMPPVMRIDVQQRVWHSHAACEAWAERWYVNPPDGFRAYCLSTGRRVT